MTRLAALLLLSACAATPEGKPAIVLAEPETQVIGYTEDGRPIVEKRPGQAVVINKTTVFRCGQVH